MTEKYDSSVRLEQLELKLMDLENSFHELNDVVLQQYKDIEQLRKRNAQLERKVDSIDDTGPAPGPLDELPPHY